MVRIGADEGFWSYDRPPVSELADRYKLQVDSAWFGRLEKATLKVSGRSGAAVMVSSDGLVMMSRHQVEPWIRDLGYVGPTILRDGFVAARRKREVKIEGLRLEQFESFSDVTSLVLSAQEGKPEEEKTKSNRSAIRELVESETTRTGLRCRVYRRDQGKRFVLFRYRIWSDLRLVFCPEGAIANFGGEFDNFSFPRWSFDVAFLRIYQDDKPIQTDNFLTLSDKTVKDNDVVVAAGFPARTRRDWAWPVLAQEKAGYLDPACELLSHLQLTLREFLKAHPDSSDAEIELSHVSNTLKALTGYSVALANPRITEVLARRQNEALSSNGPHVEELRQVITAIEETLAERQNSVLRRLYSRLDSRIAWRSRSLLSLAAELKKKPEERRRGYRDEEIEKTKASLVEPIEVDQVLESATAQTRVDLAAKRLEKNDPFVTACRRAAKGKGARAAILNSALTDPAYCQKLVAGAPQSIDESKDPMIVLVRELDPIWDKLWGEERNAQSKKLRGLEKTYEGLLQLNSRQDLQLPSLGVAPDGTPRITIGRVAGYSDEASKVPSRTSLWGLWARQRAMGEVAPFQLPDRWNAARKKLDLDTEFVLACTLEVVDNSSGSPVIGRHGDLVGIVFDSNFEGLAGMFVHDAKKSRALVLSSRIVIEALDRVYGAERLVHELTGAK